MIDLIQYIANVNFGLGMLLGTLILLTGSLYEIALEKRLLQKYLIETKQTDKFHQWQRDYNKEKKRYQ